MAALQLQQALNLGAADQIAKLHRASRSNVAVATNSNLYGWNEWVLPKEQAILNAEALECYKVPDAYASQNPIIFGKSRAVSNISCLANCFVDIDVYNIPALASMDRWDILRLILDTFPEMPMPTLFADSGRGAYLVWTFARTKPREFLPAWQQIEDSLVQLLRPFGADPHCRDASRVLRIAGTENLKSSTTVIYHEVGRPIAFEDLQRYTNKLRKQWHSEQGQVPKRKVGSVANRVLAFCPRRDLSLHHCRMQDIRRLAELRGGFSDGRKRAAFVFSLSASWYLSTVEDLNREVSAFISDCFADPEKYRGLSFGPAKRMQQGIDGVRLNWAGKEYDPRYRMRNATLIDWLQITEEEQRHMSTIISATEKKRRLTEKRRAAGVRPREEYEREAQRKADAVRLLVDQGLTSKAISEKLGLPFKSVQGYRYKR